ncbi:DUF4142 domain-containing protein [Schauerella aestuarii]|uniref:DUF4142 domain-containing protein n=1 Tax=Schauerella aestuarii TaxID=2511204 RepID=UPI00136FF50E|nr:DUF4142 domain-containing protein [Achromobacter aestuarii]
MKLSLLTPRTALVAAAVLCVHLPAFAAETLNATDAKFLQQASQGGQYSIQASELAADRADDSGVKNYATLTIQDTKRIDDTLKRLAAKKNVTLPAAPTPEQQAHLKTLGALKGKDFDVAFLKHVGGSFQFERFESFKRTAERSIDLDVRGFARTVLTNINSNYAMVNTLAKKVAPETVFPSHDTAPSR